MTACICRSRRFSPYLTPSGIPKRQSFPVGKQIGGSVYLHASAIDTLPDVVQDLVHERYVMAGVPPFDVVKWSPQADIVSFIAVDDWDRVHEPVLTHVTTVWGDGRVRTQQVAHQQKIYHHKWEFVAPDYPGFDVGAERARSAYWLNHPHVRHLKEVGVDGKPFSSVIQSYPVWQRYVLDVVFPGESGRRRPGRWC